MREWSSGAQSWSEEAETTTGEVCVYVVRGVLEVDLDGTVHALHEGDSLLFDGSVPAPAPPPRRPEHPRAVRGNRLITRRSLRSRCTAPLASSGVAPWS